MFDRLEPKVDKLSFGIATQEKIFCESFVYEPASIEGEKLGHVYMLGEIKDVSEDSFFILDYIATLVKRNYYGQTQKPCLLALEETLKKVNEGMRELLSQKKTEWLGKLHFAIGVLSQNTFYFTICGNPRIFFVRRGEANDVGEKIGAGIKDAAPQKIFRTVASGKVEKGDKIFMMTSDLFYSIPKETWTEIIASSAPSKKIKHLCSSQKLTIVNPGEILIVSFADNEIWGKEEFRPSLPSVKKPKEISSRKSNYINLFFITLKRIFKLLYLILRLIFKSLLYFLKKLFQASKKFGKILTKFLRKFRFFQKLEDKFKKIPQKPIFQKTKNTIKFLKKKLVLVPLFCLLLIFAGLFGVHHQKQKAESAHWREILEEAQLKYKGGEIALIYGAEEKAIELFSEVESLILELGKSNYFKKEGKEIRELTLSKIQKLLNMEIIENPKILATLEGFSIKFDIREIALTEDESLLFVSDPSSALFYKFDTLKKQGEFCLAPIPEGGILKTLSLKMPKGLLVFFAPPKNIFFYISSEKRLSESQILSSPYEDFEFQDLTSYKNNLYFLDSKEGEIIKFSLDEEKNDLSPGKIWLRRNAKKVIGAKSIACDGSIWVLSGNGNISKYIDGYFAQELKISAALECPEKIWTSPDRPFLYVLDPPKKRLTLLDKKGQVIKQYFSEKFNNLKDFWVSDDGNTIYLLNGNQIFIVKVEL